MYAPLLAPLLAVPITAGLAWLGLALGGRGLRTLDPAAHWTERARHVHVARRAIFFAGCLGVPATIPLAVGGPASVGAGAGPALALLLSAGTALAAFFWFEDRYVRRVGPAARLRSFAALMLALAPGYLAMLAALVTPGALGGPRRLLAYAIVVALATLGGGALLARLVGLVRPAPERLRAALGRLAPAGRAPRLWVIRALQANAFAMPWVPAVVFTEGALAHLDDAQLEAVMAHELEHLREPLLVKVWTALMAALLPIGIPAVWVLARGRSDVGRLLVADAVLLAFVLALAVHRRLRRRMEQRSDAAATALGAAHAAALERLHEVNLAPAVLRRARTHPDLVDRMAAAGVQPAWPRPAPPPPVAPALLGVVAAAAVAFAALYTARQAWPYWEASGLAGAPAVTDEAPR